MTSGGNHGGWGTLIHRLQWQSQSDLAYILPRIIPYLHNKLAQAKLLLRWVQSRQDRPSHKAGYTDEEIDIAQQIGGLSSNKGKRRQDRALSS